MSTITVEPTVDPLETIPTLPAEPSQDERLLILKRVRDYLSDRTHWTKGHYFGEETGQACLVGTIVNDIDISYEYKQTHSMVCILAQSPIHQVAYDYLKQELRSRPGPFYELESFNDDEDTTHSDIIHFLDKAIAKLEDVMSDD